MIIESSQTGVHCGFLWILVTHSCPKTSNQMIVHADFCLTNQTLLPTPLYDGYHINFTTGAICMHVGTKFVHDIATIITDQLCNHRPYS